MRRHSHSDLTHHSNSPGSISSYTPCALAHSEAPVEGIVNRLLNLTVPSRNEESTASRVGLRQPLPTVGPITPSKPRRGRLYTSVTATPRKRFDPEAKPTIPIITLPP